MLARVSVKDKETRAAVVAATLKGIQESDGSIARCFEPRHGIRVVHEKKTVELLICFACSQTEVFVDGKGIGTAPTTRSPSATLNKVLPKAKDDGGDKK